MTSITPQSTFAFQLANRVAAPSSLRPALITSQAEPYNFPPFAFGRPFFVAILAGLLLLIPAWRIPQFVLVMFVWDAIVLAIWLAELFRLPPPSQVSATREWLNAPLLACPTELELTIQNGSPVHLELDLIDAVPTSLRDTPPSFRTGLEPFGKAAQRYSILPSVRGDATVGRLFLRYRSRLGFAERWASAPIEQRVCVFPELLASADQALYMVQSRQVQARARMRREPGRGRVFESLREYQEGDELRDISWSATARRHQLVSRNYTADRNQTVWVVIDAGRLMRAQVALPGAAIALSKLDLAVNAAVAISQVATRHGDRVGLLAYGATVLQSCSPAAGPTQTRRFLDTLARLKTISGEADHARAARTLLQKQTRRALVVWLTDFSETPATPDVIAYASHLAKRHLVLFAAMAQPDLRALASALPRTEHGMFRHAAALEIVERREALLANLRRAGVLAIELEPGAVTSAVVNQYLEIKDRGLI